MSLQNGTKQISMESLETDKNDIFLSMEYGDLDHEGDQDIEQEMDQSSLTGQTQRKKRPFKKAPDAPKRFKSAYICFVTDKMEDVKKSLPDDVKVWVMKFLL